jgi:site-specific DNA-adenine methylase
MIEIPCSYQGGKQRLAKEIVNIIFNENYIDNNTKFYDLCCGSGSVSIELINRGIKPNNITMLDASPWGLFWESIGNLDFDIDRFREYITDIPKDVAQIQSHIKSLYKQPANIDTVYKFLLLQASSFGSKAIWLKNKTEWCTSSFRNYWLPTETSSRRSPVNPMMPMPKTLFERVKKISEQMVGIKGLYYDIRELTSFDDNSIIYIDPPYQNTSGYGYTFDLHTYIKDFKNKLYISEGFKFSENAHLMSGKRDKGGISGDRKVRNEEWLNVL